MCLLTALRFHELTTQSPHQVWVALPPKARIPRVATARLRVARGQRRGAHQQPLLLALARE